MNFYFFNNSNYYNATLTDIRQDEIIQLRADARIVINSLTAV